MSDRDIKSVPLVVAGDLKFSRLNLTILPFGDFLFYEMEVERWLMRKKFDFEVIDLDDGSKVGVVFSTHYISPLKRIPEIQTVCMEKTKDCNEIYFDFLLCTRNRRERYAKVHCINGQMDLKKFSYVLLSEDHAIRKFSTEYYKNNYNNLDWTYVSSENQKKIASGMIV